MQEPNLSPSFNVPLYPGRAPRTFHTLWSVISKLPHFQPDILIFFILFPKVQTQICIAYWNVVRLLFSLIVALSKVDLIPLLLQQEKSANHLKKPRRALLTAHMQLFPVVNIPESSSTIISMKEIKITPAPAPGLSGPATKNILWMFLNIALGTSKAYFNHFHTPAWQWLSSQHGMCFRERLYAFVSLIHSSIWGALQQQYILYSTVHTNLRSWECIENHLEIHVCMINSLFKWRTKLQRISIDNKHFGITGNAFKHKQTRYAKWQRCVLFPLVQGNTFMIIALQLKVFFPLFAFSEIALQIQISNQRLLTNLVISQHNTCTLAVVELLYTYSNILFYYFTGLCFT